LRVKIFVEDKGGNRMAKKGYRKKILSFLLAGLLVGTTVGSDLCVTVMASSTTEQGVAAPKAAKTVYIGDVGYDSLDAAVKATGEGQTVQISLKDNQKLSSTIVLKKGQKISLVADNADVTISRADAFVGDMFDVTVENAGLTLGKEGMAKRLILDGTPKGVAAGTTVGLMVKISDSSALTVLDKAELKNDAAKELSGEVSVTGDLIVGETLTADTLKVTPANAAQFLKFQWQRVEDGKQAENISGATQNKYVVTKDDVDKKLQVVVSASGDFKGSLVGSATGTVVKKDPTYTKEPLKKQDYGTKVKDIALPGNDLGSFVWDNSITDDTVVGDVGKHEFGVIFKPKDPDTYNEKPDTYEIEVQPVNVVMSFEVARTDIEKAAENGANVQLSANVSPVPNGEMPKGKIAFYDDTEGARKPLITKALDGNGSAKFNCTNVSIGNHKYIAEYHPEGTDNYLQTEITSELTVTRLDQTLSIAEVKDKTYGDDPFTLSVTGVKGSGEMTFSIVEGKDYIDLDAKTGKVTIKGAGEVIVKVEKKGDNNYNPGSATVEFTVAPMKLTADDVMVLVYNYGHGKLNIL
jgi:hypothetical protein